MVDYWANSDFALNLQEDWADFVAGRFWITFGCTDDGYAWAQANEWLKVEDES